MGVQGPTKAMAGGGGDGIRSRQRSSRGVPAAGERMAEGGGRAGELHLQEMPVDENGVRDVLQVMSFASLCFSFRSKLKQQTLPSV